MAHDVFISYSNRDKPIADGICANLEASGVRCWIAPRDIAPGDDWPTAISNAISESRAMVLVFSSHSNDSADVSRELILAANSNLIIIPFRIDAVVPKPGMQYYLARTHWMDAMNPPTQEQINKLVERVKSCIADGEGPGAARPAPPIQPAASRPGGPPPSAAEITAPPKKPYVPGMGMAIIVVVISILSPFLFCVPYLAAVPLCILVMRKAEKRSPKIVALAGIVVSVIALIVIGVIALLQQKR